jgi:membrane-bound ClpP family serine protease
MWTVAGVLLGVVIVASLLGFHTGPHAHMLAAAAGVLVAAWFLFMVADGRSSSLLWVILGADLALSVCLVIAAWRVLSTRDHDVRHFNSLEALEGVAVSDLTPEGIVRVRGEQWTAESVNGTVKSGARIQVLRADGVRLEVWGEEADAPPPRGQTHFQWAEDKEVEP